jgi:hypothetical protein
VSASKETGPTTVILAEEVYVLDQTAVFKPSRKYTRADRVTIRAKVLHDAPQTLSAKNGRQL